MDLNAHAIGVVVGVVVLGLLAPAVVAGASAPTAAQTAQQGGPSDGCDYAELYEETVQSVALVSRDGGQGSGFVYESFDNGTSYLVTNQHVVGTADRVELKFRRGDTQTGTVVGTVEAADLAVIRVNETPPYVTNLSVADAPPAPGHEVAALGSPFGLRSTITHGIVSGRNRTVPTDRGFLIPDVVQTDAPINPGNSGGPLVTCDGSVVGVNTAGLPAARAENIGFAVSSTLVERVVPRLIATGDYEFAYLGVQTVDVNPAIADAMDLESTRGVMVVRTTDGGPAETALQGAEGTVRADNRIVPVGGDVITAIDGQPVRAPDDLLRYLMTEASPGDQVRLTVVRDGERGNVTVTLEERPEPTTP